jgi:predicted nucleic acid-binding protein
VILVDTSVWVDHRIEAQALMGRGLGYLDAHLLASTLIGRARLWTRDRRSRQVATDLAVACRWT